MSYSELYYIYLHQQDLPSSLLNTIDSTDNFIIIIIIIIIIIDLKEIGVEWGIELIWLRIGIIRQPLWIQQCTFGFHKPWR